MHVKTIHCVRYCTLRRRLSLRYVTLNDNERNFKTKKCITCHEQRNINWTCVITNFFKPQHLYHYTQIIEYGPKDLYEFLLRLVDSLVIVRKQVYYKFINSKPKNSGSSPAVSESNDRPYSHGSIRALQM